MVQMGFHLPWGAPTLGGPLKTRFTLGGPLGGPPHQILEEKDWKTHFLFVCFVARRRRKIFERFNASL